MVPADGVKVADPALKVPPVPEVCVQTPPELSPVIKLNKLIGVELLPQIFKLPSIPAVGWVMKLIVAILESSIHGAVPSKVYVKVLFVVVADGMKVPARALKVPPVPDVLTQVPPVCSLVIIEYKSIIFYNFL